MWLQSCCCCYTDRQEHHLQIPAGRNKQAWRCKATASFMHTDADSDIADSCAKQQHEEHPWSSTVL